MHMYVRACVGRKEGESENPIMEEKESERGKGYGGTRERRKLRIREG